MKDTIPVIDISLLHADKDTETVAAQISEACRTHGFFYIKGHGVSIELQERLQKLSKTFFNLPEEEKEFLREMAASCEDLVKNGKATEAYQMVNEAALESDQQVWLWSLLTASTRASIKKAKGN